MRFRSSIIAITGLLAVIIGLFPTMIAAQSRPEQRCFAESRSSICRWLAGYWERNGVLEQLGYNRRPGSFGGLSSGERNGDPERLGYNRRPGSFDSLDYWERLGYNRRGASVGALP